MNFNIDLQALILANLNRLISGFWVLGQVYVQNRYIFHKANILGRSACNYYIIFQI